MITAQTVQLLDANNKNISPAVNIESIYFEGADSSVSPDMYRFSLRDKFIVGGKLDKLEAKYDGSTSLLIPYIYATKAFNSNSGVWQIDSALYDMGQATRDFIDAVCINKYATIQNVSSNFLDLLGNNYMKGSIKMTDGVVYDTDGIETTDTKAYVHLSESGHNVSVYGENGVKISTSNDQTVVEANQSEAYLSYKTSGSSVSAKASGVVITSNKDVSVSASTNVEVRGVETVKIYSSSIGINASNGTVDINAENIRLYEKTFPKPTNTEDTKKLLSLKTDEEMEWMTLGHLDVYNFGTQSGSKQISYIQDSSITASRISFEGGSDSYPVLGDTDTLIKVKSLTSGSETVSLDASAATTVNLATINGASILTSDDIVLPTHEEVDTAIKTKIKVSDSGAINIATVNIVDEQNFEFAKSNVTIKDNIVYAKSFAMTSDRELKTDIREDCFLRDMPAIHGFKWKDTSVQAYGFIAQELEESGFSEMVHENADGTKTVDYMTALSYKVARLEQENKKLWAAIEELKSRL